MEVRWVKDPESILDYAFNWRALGCLHPDESIVKYEITSVGVEVLRDSEEDGIVTVWVSGGTIRKRSIVSCKITTSANRIYKRSMQFIIKHK